MQEYSKLNNPGYSAFWEQFCNTKPAVPPGSSKDRARAGARDVAKEQTRRGEASPSHADRIPVNAQRDD
jgi:hypothetical protein